VVDKGVGTLPEKSSESVVIHSLKRLNEISSFINKANMVEVNVSAYEKTGRLISTERLLSGHQLNVSRSRQSLTKSQLSFDDEHVLSGHKLETIGNINHTHFLKNQKTVAKKDTQTVDTSTEKINSPRA